MGLPADRDLIEKLAGTPGVVSRVQEFGAPLTEEEAQIFRKARETQNTLNELGKTLWEIPGYAGAVIEWGGRYGAELQSLTVRTTDGQGNVLNGTKSQQLIDEAHLNKLVTVESANTSWIELIAYSDILTGNTSNPFDGATQNLVGREWGQLQAAARRPEFANNLLAALPPQLQNKQRQGTLVAGYSLAQNSLLLGTSNAEERGSYKATLSKGRTVDINIVDIDELEVTPEALCEKQGCSATRAGVEIEFAGSTARCTLGFAVARNGDASYLTAGHCGWRSFDAQMQSSSSWSLTRSVDRQLGTTGVRQIQGIDLQRINVNDRFVTNRLRGSQGNGQRVTGSQWPTNGMIGTSVCKSGAVTDITCGEVTDVGVTVTYEGSRQIFNVINTDYGSDEGDSGSPVYQRWNNTIAVGSHVGANGSTRRVQGMDALGTLQAGLWLHTTTNRPKDFLLGLYEEALGTFPDNNGFDWHLNNIDNGCNGTNLSNQRNTAYAFYTSTGFSNRFPLTSDTSRRTAVKAVYQGLLQRSPIWDETAYWANVAINDWPTVVWSIAASGEFSDRFWNGGTTYDGKIC